MGHGFSLPKVQCVESNTITHPIRFNCRLKGHILELQDSTKYLRVDLQSSLSWKKTYRQDLQESKQYAGVFVTQTEVMQRGYQSQRLLYHGEMESGVLLCRLEPSQ